MSPISSGTAVGRRAQRLDVRPNGRLFAEPAALAGWLLPGHQPAACAYPGHRSDVSEVRSEQ